MIIQLFSVLILAISHGEEGADLSLGFLGRTYPIAGQLEVNAGYGKTLWNNNDAENTIDPWYGYVRPYVNVRGPSTPTGTVGLDLFPVSFAGIGVGRTYMWRLVEQPEINCDIVECLEWLNSTFVQGRVYGKYQKLFIAATYEKTYYDDMSDLSKMVFQSNNAVMQSPRGERGDDIFVNIGYEINDEWSMGVALEYFSSRESKNKQDMQLLFARLIHKKWTWTAGAGRFYSTPLGTGLELTLTIGWELEKRLGYR